MAVMNKPCPAIRIALASSFRSRLVGLLGRSSMSLQQGLWIEPCNRVHTFGMRFAIDLVFVDHQRTILRLVRNLPPWRIAACPRSRAVIELAAGACDHLRLQQGQRWMFEPERS